MVKTVKYLGLGTVVLLLIVWSISTFAQSPSKRESSYSPVVITETFESIMARDKAEKPKVMKQHMDLLNERYNLSKKVTTEVTMSRGKALPVGPTAKLRPGLSWDKLAQMTPEEIKGKDLFPFRPLPHPKHEAGGIFSPKRK